MSSGAQAIRDTHRCLWCEVGRQPERDPHQIYRALRQLVVATMQRLYQRHAPIRRSLYLSVVADLPLPHLLSTRRCIKQTA